MRPRRPCSRRTRRGPESARRATSCLDPRARSVRGPLVRIRHHAKAPPRHLRRRRPDNARAPPPRSASGGRARRGCDAVLQHRLADVPRLVRAEWELRREGLDALLPEVRAKSTCASPSSGRSSAKASCRAKSSAPCSTRPKGVPRLRASSCRVPHVRLLRRAGHRPALRHDHRSGGGAARGRRADRLGERRERGLRAGAAGRRGMRGSIARVVTDRVGVVALVVGIAGGAGRAVVRTVEPQLGDVDLLEHRLAARELRAEAIPGLRSASARRWHQNLGTMPKLRFALPGRVRHVLRPGR